ncbi:hypothetical protein PHYPSEUDO_001294 [Phytophthora pseudosyringae]|uniref:Uncharacterized protein n=1 Tax=Phytophthora pseudosyringae TaxID=221518 RepID=A0A8T1W003_9STRA|nr:hypothetical protein PHYPSEUDO_001294 [Phytophthora pseudosyringae]
MLQPGWEHGWHVCQRREKVSLAAFAACLGRVPTFGVVLCATTARQHGQKQEKWQQQHHFHRKQYEQHKQQASVMKSKVAYTIQILSSFSASNQDAFSRLLMRTLPVSASAIVPSWKKAAEGEGDQQGKQEGGGASLTIDAEENA